MSDRGFSRDPAVEQWHRQLLQRDRPLSVEEAVLEAGGIYSTAPTSYLSFVARVPGFQRGDLDRALYEDRKLVRMSALRGSGFLIPLEMVDAVVSGSDRKDVFSDWAEKLVGAKRRDEWRKDILKLLDGQVLLAREIRKHFDASGKDAEALRHTLSSMTVRRELAAASGPRSWRDNQYGYALWSQWFPEHPPRDMDRDDARVTLARWYLRGHGPAVVGDFAWWAGMKKANAAKAFADAGLIEVGEGLFDLPNMPEPPEASGMRLLPIWDTALVRQKQWRRMVPESLYPFVYDSSGNVTSTIIRDGEVVGVWDRGGDRDRLEIVAAFFGRRSVADEAAVEAEASIVAAALGVSELQVSFKSEVVDLHTASRNRFYSPLSGS